MVFLADFRIGNKFCIFNKADWDIITVGATEVEIAGTSCWLLEAPHRQR